MRVPAGCPASPTESVASAFGDFGLNIPLKNLSSGRHTIYVNWTIRASGYEYFALTNCTLHKPPAKINPVYIASCWEGAQVYLSAYADIFDTFSSQSMSANSSTWPGLLNLTEFSNTSVCYSSRCYVYTYGPTTPANVSFSFTILASMVFVNSFTAQHTYWVQTTVGASVEVGWAVQNARLSPGAHGSASVNLGSLGNNATLSSITVL